jgi:hypothetical protein
MNNIKNYKEIIEIIKSNKFLFMDVINKINAFTNLNEFIIKVKEEEVDSKEIIKLLLLKSEIIKEYFFLILDKINNLKGNYCKAYCNEYKLFLIMHVYDDIYKWTGLKRLSYYCPKSTKLKHYESLRTQFERWSSKNIFKNVFENIEPYENKINMNVEQNKEIIEIDKTKYSVDVLKDFFIDSTAINNLRGSEKIIINPENKKKKITKITEISDVDGFVVSVSFNNPYNKVINYNNKQTLIRTAKHDSKCIDEAYHNIKNIDKSNIYLIGDKGYKINNINDNYEIITPNKKNQKNNLINRHQKDKINYRHIVENSINGWKHKNRINLRKDKKIINFSSWVYISLIEHNLNINKRKQEIYKIINK